MADNTPDADLPPDGVPSFLGLSMREASTRAHDGGFAVTLRGSGYVVAQEPRAGSPLADERRLALQFHPDRATALP